MLNCSFLLNRLIPLKNQNGDTLEFDPIQNMIFLVIGCYVDLGCFAVFNAPMLFRSLF